MENKDDDDDDDIIEPVDNNVITVASFSSKWNSCSPC